MRPKYKWPVCEEQRVGVGTRDPEAVWKSQRPVWPADRGKGRVCLCDRCVQIHLGSQLSPGLSSQQQILVILTGMQAPRLCSKSQSEFQSTR